MDTTQNIQPEILDFHSFIKKYFNWFVFDQYNTEIVKNIGLWAIRSEKFNGKQIGWHIDRGILLYGPVGVGKDVIFRILLRYLKYLRSPYQFTAAVVWEFAQPFSDKDKGGLHIFNPERTGNRYYEELALTDEESGFPDRERAIHMGQRVFIGSEIIQFRYNSFIQNGYQTHFSTNLKPDDLEKIYGTRCISRLREMCNMMVVGGEGKRGKNAPILLGNKNQVLPPAPKEISMDEIAENKALADNTYQKYVNEGVLPDMPWVMYNLLVGLGVSICTEDEMRAHMEEISHFYSPGITRRSESEREREKAAYVWEHSRKAALGSFYEKMKAGGAKSIFGQVSIEGVVRTLVEDKK